jgi:DNA gyrase subunit A
VKDIRTMGRATQGVRFIRLEEKDKLVSIARVVKEEDDDGGGIERAQVPAPDESNGGAPAAPPAPPDAPPDATLPPTA